MSETVWIYQFFWIYLQFSIEQGNFLDSLLTTGLVDSILVSILPKKNHLGDDSRELLFYT